MKNKFGYFLVLGVSIACLSSSSFAAPKVNDPITDGFDNDIVRLDDAGATASYQGGGFWTDGGRKCAKDLITLSKGLQPGQVQELVCDMIGPFDVTARTYHDLTGYTPDQLQVTHTFEIGTGFLAIISPKPAS